MELIEGKTLREEVAYGSNLSANDAREIGIALCDALEAVHGAGVIHGDIKAHNVMRESGGRIVLMDFGAARLRDPEQQEAKELLAGTKQYMAPELFDLEEPTVASDIYALGVLLFFLVSGRYPVRGATGNEIEKAHQRDAPKLSLRRLRPDLPEDFATVVERALSRSRFERHGSATELRSELGPEKAGGRLGLIVPRVVRVSIVLVWVTVVLTAIGWVSTRVFEGSLRVPSQFRSGLDAYLTYGAYAVVPQLMFALVVGALTAVAAVVSAPLKRWLAPRLEPIGAWVIAHDPRILAACIVTAGAAAWLAIVTLFQDIFVAVVFMGSLGPGAPEVRDVLGAKGRVDRHLLTLCATALTMALVWSLYTWFPVLIRQVRAAGTVRALRWAVVVVAFVSSASAGGLWRLTFEYFEIVSYRERQWLVVAAHDSELLLYDDCDASRLIATLGVEEDLLRTGEERKLFAGVCASSSVAGRNDP